MTTMTDSSPFAFSADLRSDDSFVNYWLGQVTLRLRREVCWLWHQRRAERIERAVSQGSDSLPPPTDPVVESLDFQRFADAKCHFFRTDMTAGYLTERIVEPPPAATSALPERGSFAWLITMLKLKPCDCFALAAGLLTAFDHAAGPIVAACLNRQGVAEPTLGLLQRLWDEPADVLHIVDPTHGLWRFGILQHQAGDRTSALRWDDPLVIHPLVSQQLLHPGHVLANVLLPVRKARRQTGNNQPLHAAPWLFRPASSLRIGPLVGPRGSDFEGVVSEICHRAGRHAVRFVGDQEFLLNPFFFPALATYCWLRDVDLMVDCSAVGGGDTGHAALGLSLPPRAVPLNLFIATESAQALSGLSPETRMPAVESPRLSLQERVELWREGLQGVDESTVIECGRRFRFQRGSIQRICDELGSIGTPSSRDALFAACRAETQSDIGDLAVRVLPRFSSDELVLPDKQMRQLDEVRRAMRSLSTVHYGWGTARVWDEAGLSVLFCGGPGTGKSTAAEILARDLDLPLYKIDLSQVVNKYVGETPKRLKRLFDAAEVADLILVFEEADALFGKRTSVRDAHDRYANVEINYLLTRMESSKGLTILATNRRGDLDAAFTRRLRFIVEFPQPDHEQRRKIWQKAIPEGVDASKLDLDFLAARFPLSGGHIRSAVFHACLQSAANRNSRCAERRLEMPAVVCAVRRELDKQHHRISLSQFGPYMREVRKLEGKELIDANGRD